MPSLVLIIVIGLLGGIAIGLQAPLASAISQRLGALESIFIVHLGGALAAGLALAFAGGGRLGQWQAMPPVALLAGLLGVVCIGATVYTLGTVRRRGDHPGTMQTPGLPDVLAFLPQPWPRMSTGVRAGVVLLVVEVKAAGGRLSDPQREFHTLCDRAGVAYVVGDLDAVIGWLQQHGYLRGPDIGADGMVRTWEQPT